MSDISKLVGGWLSYWHLGLVGATFLASVVQFKLTGGRPEARRELRNNLLFALLCLLVSVLVYRMSLAGTYHTAEVLYELVTLALGLLLIRVTGLTAFRVLLPALGLNPPAILEDILLVLTYIVWGMVRLRMMGLELTGLVATSAVITAVIAFSMQETLGNILGGLALQLDNSVRIGDWICVDDVRGQVVEVHWRHTDVYTTNGHLIVVPNGMLMKSKVDVFSRVGRSQFRRWLKFRVSDSVPPQDVIKTVLKALREAQIEYMSDNPAVDCIVVDSKEGMIEYAVRYWLTDPRHDDGTDSVVRVHYYNALKRQNYSFAHPCTDIRLVSDTSRRHQIQYEEELARRKQALSLVPLFRMLSAEEISHIASAMRHTPFVKNDVMTRQGAVAHWLYLLVEGEADVWYEASDGRRTHLACLQDGTVFGEMGLLTGAPRSATVIAKSDAICYRLDKEMFETVLHKRPELASEFAHILSQRSKELAALKHKENMPQQELLAHESYVDNIRHFFGLS